METAKVICEVMDEIIRAEEKHPEWPKDVMYLDQIVNEEKGEATRAVVQYALEGGSIDEVRKELIQTAAMCVRLIKNLPKK